MKGKVSFVIFIIAFLLTVDYSKGASDKYEKLFKAINKKTSAIADFTDESIDRYAKSARDFHLIVFLTTDSSSVGCEACPQFNAEYSQLAKIYRDSLGPNFMNSTAFSKTPIFFARCEVMKCMEFFQKGQYQSFPVMLYFPPTTNEVEEVEYNKLYTLDIYEDISAVTMAAEVHRVTGYNMIPERPMYQDILLWVVAISSVFIVLRYAIPSVYGYMKTPLFWFIAAVGVFAFVMAGTVYNSIHAPPFAYRHPQSKQLYLIYPSARQQFVGEGLIMAGLFTFGGVFLIAFNSHVATEPDPMKQRIFFAIFAFSFFVCFQWTMKIFKMKYPYYPLW